MKDYKEVTSEILKRRDAHRTYIKKLKKRIVVLLAVFAVCLSVGGGAWMIGTGSRNVPDVPTVTETKAESMSETAAESIVQIETVETAIPTEETGTQPVETEPATTEPLVTEPVWTEPVWTGYYETEPLWTEPPETEPVQTEYYDTEFVWTEPIETEPVQTEQKYTGPVPLGSLVTSVYYPETESESEADTEPAETNRTDGGDSVQGSTNSGSITGYFTEPSSYRLSFWPREFTFDGGDAFFIESNEIPDKFPVYVVGDLPYLPSIVPYVKLLAEKLYGSSVTDSIDTYIYDSGDEYGTTIRVYTDTIRVDEYNDSDVKVTPTLILKNAETVRRGDFTYDEIYEYVTSLPHLEVMLSYVGLEDYMVEKTFIRTSDTNYGYKFVFIPKTDDPVEALVYRASKYVEISGYIGNYEYESNLYVCYSGTNTPYVTYESVDTLSYNEAYEKVMTVAEKYGVRDYFEHNMICVVSSDSGGTLRPYYYFYIAFTDENGNVVYCEPYEEGLYEDGKDSSSWFFGNLNVFLN